MSDTNQPRYPEITVELVGHDGNAMSIISRVRRALINGKVDDEKVTEFVNEAMSGDYNNVLKTCMEWVVVE